MPVQVPHPTRKLLIQTALELFAAEGVRGTTVRKIESAAGLTPGAGGMYRHFRSKEDLLVAAVEAYYDEVLAFGDTLPQLLAIEDLRSELRQAVALFREFNERHDALVRVLLLEGLALPEQARRRLEQCWEQAYLMYSEALRRRLGDNPGIDLEATAIQMFGSLAGYHAQQKTFARAPIGVDEQRFVDSWVNHWATFLEGHRARAR